MRDGELIPPGEDYTRPPPLRPRVEVSTRALSLRIYLHDSDDYDACCQLQIYGDQGWLHSITGAGFYLAMHQLLAKFRELGLKSVGGYVVPAHARLAARQAEKAGVTFELGEAGTVDGHALVWATWRL